MPNWCWNNLQVSGDSKQLKEFIDKSFIKNEDGYYEFTFSGTYPEPDYETTPVAQTYPRISAGFAKTEEDKAIALENKPTIRKDSWWHWRVQNWGTKWEPSGQALAKEEVFANDQYIEVSFDTAWGPPNMWLKHIYTDFPNLTFELEYEEPGMMFGGVINADKLGYNDYSHDLANASDCCTAKVYWEDDEEFTLEDEGEYQCSKCKKECETELINENETNL